MEHQEKMFFDAPGCRAGSFPAGNAALELLEAFVGLRDSVGQVRAGAKQELRGKPLFLPHSLNW